MSSIGKRLEEVRNRFGLNKTAFAAIGGVSTTSQTNYEENLRSPDSDYFEKIAAAGADVLYVITGRATPPGDLTNDEMLLVNNYRGASEKRRVTLLAVSSAFAEADK